MSWFPSELAVMHKQDPAVNSWCQRHLGHAGRRGSAYLLVGLKMKNELASGIGTAFSFSCSSARGRGRGLRGISGSSSSSSPVGRPREGKRRIIQRGNKYDCMGNFSDPMALIWHASQKDLSTPRLVEVHCILTWEVCRRVGVFDLIDIGFKFVHFQLKQGRDREEDVPVGQTCSPWKPHETSSITAFGPYSTNNMECWPRLEPAERMLKRGWETKMCAGQEPGAMKICREGIR